MSKEKTRKSSSPNQEKDLTPSGGKLHQIAGSAHPALTTNQGLALPIIKTRSGPISRGLRCWKISSCAKKLPILIMNGFPSASFMRVRRACMATSS